jgi:hypothetical protein
MPEKNAFLGNCRLSLDIQQIAPFGLPKEPEQETRAPGNASATTDISAAGSPSRALRQVRSNSFSQVLKFILCRCIPQLQSHPNGTS